MHPGSPKDIMSFGSPALLRSSVEIETFWSKPSVLCYYVLLCTNSCTIEENYSRKFLSFQDLSGTFQNTNFRIFSNRVGIRSILIMNAGELVCRL
jgi:hypothetical protein